MAPSAGSDSECQSVSLDSDSLLTLLSAHSSLLLCLTHVRSLPLHRFSYLAAVTTLRTLDYLLNLVVWQDHEFTLWGTETKVRTMDIQM